MEIDEEGGSDLAYATYLSEARGLADLAGKDVGRNDLAIQSMLNVCD